MKQAQDMRENPWRYAMWTREKSDVKDGLHALSLGFTKAQSTALE